MAELCTTVEVMEEEDGSEVVISNVDIATGENVVDILFDLSNDTISGDGETISANVDVGVDGEFQTSHVETIGPEETVEDVSVILEDIKEGDREISLVTDWDEYSEVVNVPEETDDEPAEGDGFSTAQIVGAGLTALAILKSLSDRG